jgi:hypothetical protein
VTCWWCGEESTVLCDRLIGCERRKSDNTLIVDEGYTCDAELCRAHAKQIGHMCGGKPDTIDVCPVHVDGLGGDLSKLATTKAGAEKVRREIRATALRSRIRMVRR